ncbi:hypothetical protein PIPA1_00860 [Pelosinus sp. IPA-1]|nr:hypothetical protein PIPA1_00860 [Pelosinus sp. IPA-1]
MVDFTTILQIKLGLSLICNIVAYFTCMSFEKGIELFKHYIDHH